MKKLLLNIFSILLFLCGIINVYAEERVVIKFNTEGQGQIEVVPEGEKIVFDEEYPFQSSVQNATIGSKYTAGAKANEKEGYQFIKWTLDGKDYSTEDTITVTAEKECEYIAIFEFKEENKIISENKEPEETDDNNILMYMVIGAGLLLIIVLGIIFVTKKK